MILNIKGKIKCHIKEYPKRTVQVKEEEQIKEGEDVFLQERRGGGEDEMNIIKAISMLLFVLIVVFGFAIFLIKSYDSPQILAQEQALIQSDEYMKSLFDFIINDPRLQTNEARQFMADVFPIMRQTVKQYVNWLYKNGYQIVEFCK